MNSWRETKRENVYKNNWYWINKVTFVLPNGKVRDMLIQGERSFTGVFALTPEKKVILVKQFRPGPGRELYALPGGFIEDAEDDLENIKKELLEETGFTGDFSKVTVIQDRSYTELSQYLFVATNCKKIQEQHLNDSEFIQVIECSIDELRRLLREGQMDDMGLVYRALDHLGYLK